MGPIVAMPVPQDRARQAWLLLTCGVVSERQLLVDHPLELLERLSTAEHAPIDAKGWSARHAGLFTLLRILVDRVAVLVRVETHIESALIESKLSRIRLEVCDVELVRICEEQLVIRPEFILLRRALRRF